MGLRPNRKGTPLGRTGRTEPAGAKEELQHALAAMLGRMGRAKPAGTAQRKALGDRAGVAGRGEWLRIFGNAWGKKRPGAVKGPLATRKVEAYRQDGRLGGFHSPYILLKSVINVHNL